MCVFTFSAFAADDIYYYQGKFADFVDSVQIGQGPKDSVQYAQVLDKLGYLYANLSANTEIRKKEPLLSEMKAVYIFMGEIAPGPKSYYLTIAQKKKAMALLGLKPESYSDSSSFCLPIYRVKLWNDNYTAFLADNLSDSMMVVYQIDMLAQKKHTTISGFVNEGISKKCSRSIYEAFGNFKSVRFRQQKCEQQLQVVTYIQPEVEKPKIVVYPEPDYLSPKQKQALKRKQKEQLRKEKEKAKKEALKAKDNKKKEQLKNRDELKKAQIDAREEKAKEAKGKKNKDNSKDKKNKKDKDQDSQEETQE